jgi:hypothetical protein
MKKNVMWLLASAGILGGVLMYKHASASSPSCFIAEAEVYYIQVYRGNNNLLPNVFGDAWAVVRTVDLWDNELGDWEPILYPNDYVLKTGTTVLFCFMEDVEVCGFSEE